MIKVTPDFYHNATMQIERGAHFFLLCEDNMIMKSSHTYILSPLATFHISRRYYYYPNGPHVHEK